MTYPIGTEVTYNGIRCVIVSMEEQDFLGDTWYKIQGIDTDFSLVVPSADLYDIVEPTPTPEPPTPEPPSEEDYPIIIPGEQLDLCQGVVCDQECDGGDKYDSTCADGVCVRGVLIETNSPDCPGYIAPVAKGDITTATWEACHPDPRAGGCRSDIAYWGADVHVSTNFTNVGTAPGRFRIRLKDAADTILAETEFESVNAGESRIHITTFVMPHVQSLALTSELRREVIL